MQTEPNSCDPKGKDLIFVRCGLAEQSDAALLLTAYRRYKYSSKTGRAVWSGYCALNRVYERSVREARLRGQLLFFFPGTTVLHKAVAA